MVHDKTQIKYYLMKTIFLPFLAFFRAALTVLGPFIILPATLATIPSASNPPTVPTIASVVPSVMNLFVEPPEIGE